MEIAIVIGIVAVGTIIAANVRIAMRDGYRPAPTCQTP